MAIIVRLDRVMADRKIKLLDLANKVGITYANLSNLKNGKVNAIRFSTLESICKELNCQPGDILEYLDDEIMNLINSFAKSDIEVEGALNRLYAYANMKGENISLELAKECFNLDNKITIEKIKKVVSDYYKIEDIALDSRKKDIVNARNVAIYLCKTETNESFKMICESFNIEDMVQVMYACDNITNNLKNDIELQNDINEILSLLNR